MRRRSSYAVQLLVCLFVFSLLVPALLNAEPELPTLDRGPGIYDFADMVDAGWETEVDALIKEIETKTTAEIAVVTIKSLEGEPLEDYSIRLFEKAGIGKKDKDNGVLMLVAKEERKIRIDTGYGVEPVLPDGKCGQISREIITPRFKEGDFGQGIYDGLLAIGNVLGEETEVSFGGTGQTERADGASSSDSSSAGLVAGSLIVLVAVLVIGLVVWLAIRRRKCPKCGARMNIKSEVLEQATYISSGRRRVIRDCPKCGFHDEKEETISQLSDTSDSGNGWSSGSSGGSSGGSFGGGSSGGGGSTGRW